MVTIAGTKFYVSTCEERGLKTVVFAGINMGILPKNETQVLKTWIFSGHYETHF